MQTDKQSLVRDKYFLLTILIGGFFLWLTLWFGFGLDQSIYAYGAWVWKNHGLPPYTGVWDPNFPGIFLINFLVQTIFGDKIISFRIFDFLIQLSSLAMIYHLTKKLSGSSLAGFLSGVFFSIYYFGNGITDTGQREGYILWLMLAALAISFALEKRVWSRAVLTGLCLGFAFLIKPTYGLCWLVFGGLFLAQGVKTRPKKVYAELLFLAFFCFLPSLLVIFYYWRMELLGDLYQALIWYNLEIYRNAPNLVYAELPKWFLPVIITHDLFIQAPVILLPIPVALMAWRAKPAEDKESGLFVAVCLLAAISLVSYLMFRRYFPYQLLPFWGMTSVLAGWAWVTIGDAVRSKIADGKARLVIPMFYSLLLVFMLANLNPEVMIYAAKHSFRGLQPAYLDEDGYYSDPHQTVDQQRAAVRLKSMLKPGEKFEFLGPYPLVPFLLQQKSASRFCSLQIALAGPSGKPLTARQQEWADEYLVAIKNSPPRLFLIHDFIPGHLSVGFSSSSMKAFISEKFPELDKFLSQNYRLIDRVGTVEIYEFRPQ